MPKGTRPASTASKTYYTNDEVTGVDGKTKLVDPAQTRNYVGDQGAAKVAKGKSTDVVSSSDAQETPAAKRIRLKKAMDDENDELVGKVKSAMGKRGGPLVQSNYE